MKSDANGPNLDLVGYEWEAALEVAASHHIELQQVITAPPKGAGHGTLRVVRQRIEGGTIWCTCASEDWGEGVW